MMNDLFLGERIPPNSPKKMTIRRVGIDFAIKHNEQWRSRLPDVAKLTVMQKHHVCYGAEFNDHCFAIAIWSDPVAREFAKFGFMLELRRLVIASDAPKFSATWMIGQMTKDLRKLFPDIYKLISYQDTEVHTGTIYAASNWKKESIVKGREWTTPSRERKKVQSSADKIRWVYELRPEKLCKMGDQ